MKLNIVQAVKLGAVACLLAVTTHTIGQERVVGCTHGDAIYLVKGALPSGGKVELRADENGFMYADSDTAAQPVGKEPSKCVTGANTDGSATVCVE